MGAEPKSLLERWLEAGDAGDVEAFHELLHDDIVVHAPLGLSCRGIAAEKDMWRAAVEAIAQVTHGKASEVWEVADVGVLLRGGR